MLTKPAGEQVWLRSPWPFLLSICGIATLWVLLLGTPLEFLELRWFGQILRWRYEKGLSPPADPSIVHVDVTRDDLAKVPTLQLEYLSAASIVNEATALGARVVSFDVIFGRGDEAMARPILDAVSRAKADGRSVIFAEAFLPSAQTGKDERVRSFPFRERLEPAGIINVQADGDGVLRHYDYVFRNAADKEEPSLALASYLAWRDVSFSTGVTRPRPGVLQWEEISSDFTSVEPRQLRLDPILLNYRSPWSGRGSEAFKHYTVGQLHSLFTASQAAHAQPLTNAVVFVTYQGAGLGDVGTTSLAANQPRVILHSTALDDLIQRNWIKRSSRSADALAVASLIALGAAAAFWRGTLPLLVLWVAGIVGAAMISGYLIVKAGSVVSLVTAASVWSLIVLVELGRRQSYEFMQRLKLRSTMSLYFSPQIMEHVLKNPGSMDPQKADITVLLTDVRNSTPIAEALGPAGMFALLNQIFEVQTHAIMAENGSMEHFLGDQFLSYWGAPNPQPDAADRAFRAALALIAGMETARPKLDPRIAHLFGYGVALHSGEALIGNKGSAQRLDYGLVGDLINAAARVEALTKQYGVLFLVTREAYDQLSDKPMMRVVDKAIAKGTSYPLELLEVRHALSPANFEEVTARYNIAFAAYDCGRFQEAGRLFTAICADAADGPSALMSARCNELAANPPADWTGIYHLNTK